MRKTRKTLCRVKCLRELSWNGTFRVAGLFTWIGNVFQLPQDVYIPRTWHLLRFVGIIVLFKVMEVGFLTLTIRC